MGFNPFNNRPFLHPLFTIIISAILFSLGFKGIGEIVFIFSVIWFIAFKIIRINKKKQKASREKEFQKFVKRTNASHFSSYDKVFKEGIAMQCFSAMENPYFYNVIDKSDEENGNLYIGELEWVAHMELSLNSRNESNFATRTATDTDGQQTGNKSYATMCVAYDKNFRLPNFDLTKETLGKRTAEVLKLNKSIDIDFEDDKKFSDAWWLTTNETMIVKDLFTKPIRTKLMSFINRNYRISGQGNMIIIITDNVLLPDEYARVVYDMRAIQRILKTNQKFYVTPRQPKY